MRRNSGVCQTSGGAIRRAIAIVKGRRTAIDTQAMSASHPVDRALPYAWRPLSGRAKATTLRAAKNRIVPYSSSR